MNQVIHNLHATHGGRNRVGLQHIALHNFNLLQPRAALKARGITYQTTNTVTRGEQARNKSSTHITGGASD